MKVLRTAVIGLGRVGWRYHAVKVHQHEGFALVAVVDPVEERLEEAKTHYGTKGYKTHEQLFESEPVDLVVVASPTEFHCEQTLAAFNCDCDVFCDKPMAMSLEQADTMIDAMRSHGRKLMLYQPHRAIAEVVSLREVLSRGLIGDVYMIKRAHASYVRRNDWQAFRKHGGGMLNNYGSHYIDQLLYLAGSIAKRVSCATRAIATLGDADDVVKVVIETENDIILDLDINMASCHPMVPWQVLGQRGGIVFDRGDKAWKIRYFDEKDLGEIPVWHELAAPNRKYNVGETIPWKNTSVSVLDYQGIDYYQKCYDYFALGKEPFVPVDETRELMRVIEACRAGRSSASGQ